MRNAWIRFGLISILLSDACRLFERGTDLRIRGTVSSSRSGSPIGGAEVALVDAGDLYGFPLLGVDTTDTLGRYRLSARFWGDLCITLRIMVNPAGYVGTGLNGKDYGYETNEVQCTDQVQVIDFRLRPVLTSLTLSPQSATVQARQSQLFQATATFFDGTSGPESAPWWLPYEPSNACGSISPPDGATTTYIAPDVVPTVWCGTGRIGEVLLMAGPWELRDSAIVTIVP